MGSPSGRAPLPDTARSAEFTKLLVATRNLGKAREYEYLLRGVPVSITSLDELGIYREIEETGGTFKENARIKATGYAALSGLLTLADDSGLEVDALGGAPGVRSARYAGPEATDSERVKLLLEHLEGTPRAERTGRFRCVIAVSTPTGEVSTVSGAVEGIISREPKGTNGFGYDPIFQIPDLGRTMAELSIEEKNRISHRAQAAKKAVALLKSMLAGEVAGLRPPAGES